MVEGLVDGLVIEPRPYQVEAVEEAIRFFSTPSGRPLRSVLIEFATGSGKTIMGLLVARHFQRTEGTTVGWVAMRRYLLAQVEGENRLKGFNLDLRIISMFDKSPPRVDFLVIDEAQHDGAASMATLTAKVNPRFILGLSATPYRSDGVALCFEKVIRRVTINNLIQAGHLSRYHHYTVPRHDPETIAETFLREPDRWGQSLVFFHRMEQCLDCQVCLERGGIRSEVVTSSSDRERQIRDFVARRVQVLLSMIVLTEGFDCPELQTVFVRPSVRCPTLQMAGRVFRKHPSLEVKQVVQCRDTRYPLPRAVIPDEQFIWSPDGWRALKGNRDLEAITRRTLAAVVKAEAPLPRLLVRNRHGSEMWWRRAARQEAREDSS
jgi:superfamily II DNA or RNA helicase